MGLKNFKPPTLPSPPPEYEQRYLMQLIRVLGIYQSQQGSLTPLAADNAQWTAIPKTNELAYNALENNEMYCGENEDILRIKRPNVAYEPVATKAELALKVDRSGDTMTGPLTVPELNATDVNATDVNATDVNAQNFNGGLFTGDGYGVALPHIAASDSTDQFALGTDVPTVVTWDTLDAGYGWALNPPGSASPLFGGVYKITYSLQFTNTDTSQHTAVCWLQVNGVDVPNSTTSFSILPRKNPTVAGFTCAYSEVTFRVNPGDVVELYWATDAAATSGGGLGVSIFHDPPQTVPYSRPAIPSAIGSIVFVSAI